METLLSSLRLIARRYRVAASVPNSFMGSKGTDPGRWLRASQRNRVDEQAKHFWRHICSPFRAQRVQSGKWTQGGKDMAKRVADLLVDVLVEAGVQRVYGVSGDSLNGITDSIRTRKQMQWVHVRHEEVAAFAAGAEAHLTGKLAVCAGSCGPGNLHLINGLYDCHRSRVPVLAMPGDIALKDAVAEGPRLRFHEPAPNVSPSEEELNILADVLNRSKKPTILGGAGCAGAHAELIELAGKLQAPIVHAMRGKEFIEYDNPYDVGMTGLLGFSSGYHAMLDCDVLLMIGTDFPYEQL